MADMTLCDPTLGPWTSWPSFPRMSSAGHCEQQPTSYRAQGFVAPSGALTVAPHLILVPSVPMVSPPTPPVLVNYGSFPVTLVPSLPSHNPYFSEPLTHL